jgi:type VI secretion system protein ImpB
MAPNKMPLSINDEIPKSRITLTYRTTAGGEREDVNLPFRLLIMGDLSNGSSKDRREAELDKRTIRNLDGRNLDAMMKDMDMSMEFDVENRVDPDGGDVHVKLKVDSMKSLGPAEIAQQIPKVKSLLLLRKLLMEVQANLDNHKEFRKLIRTLAQTKTSEDLRTELARLGDFKDFQVPELQPKAAPSEDGAEG